MLKLTCDGFLGKRLMIQQPSKGYKSGMDAVLLAASIPAIEGESYLELGSGVGVVALCLAERVRGCHVVGVEILEDMVKIACDNALLNKLEERVHFIHQDISVPFGQWENMKPSCFHAVFANPPFYKQDSNIASRDISKRVAHMATDDLLDIWIRRACTLVKSGGHVSVLHCAEALSDILLAMRGRFGGIKVLPIASYENAPAGRVIIRGIRDSKTALEILPPVILHQKDGTYQPYIERILRHGERLAF